MIARARHLAMILVGVVLIAFAVTTYGAAAGYAAEGAPLPRVTTPATMTANPSALVLDVSGIGPMVMTPEFTTGDDWTTAYAFTCDGDQSFSVEVWDADNREVAQDILANTVDQAGADVVTEATYAGRHYLFVDTPCAWHVQVWSSRGGGF